MAISKRLRYEILRRDNFTCRYCGARSAETPLEVDHVIPEALGGKTESDNLAAACADCNAGKAATSPDDQRVAQVSQDALRWSEAMRNAAAVQARDRAERESLVSFFRWRWDTWTTDDGETMPLPTDWPDAIARFHSLSVEMELIQDAVDITARASRVGYGNEFRYFCGIVYRKLEQRQMLARDLLDRDGEPPRG
jgi:hypothetical protein